MRRDLCPATPWTARRLLLSALDLRAARQREMLSATTASQHLVHSGRCHSHVGGQAGTVFVEKIDEVRRFATRFDHLRAAALDMGDTAEMIADIARDM